jgi:tRNA (guanine-N7-)-methyltransferase
MSMPKSQEIALESSNLAHTGISHKLPIHHADFRYTESKNPYWAKLQDLKGIVYSDHEAEVHAGQWRSQFSDQTASSERQLHVEIGCNAGHVIVEWAKQNPQHAYIGLDWKFKIIFKGAEKVKKRDLKNLIFFRGHAERLEFMFAPQEIDRLSLFFPDPWPKKAHWKNRLVTADRLRTIAKLMKPDGVFHIKTDHAGYFDWMLDAISQAQDSWEVVELTRNLHEFHPAPETLKIPDVTLFERLFIKDGIPIQSVKLKPRKPSSENHSC